MKHPPTGVGGILSGTSNHTPRGSDKRSAIYFDPIGVV
jgi:hypothetical protein